LIHFYKRKFQRCPDILELLPPATLSPALLPRVIQEPPLKVIQEPPLKAIQGHLQALLPAGIQGHLLREDIQVPHLRAPLREDILVPLLREDIQVRPNKVTPVPLPPKVIQGLLKVIQGHQPHPWTPK